MMSPARTDGRARLAESAAAADERRAARLWRRRELRLRRETEKAGRLEAGPAYGEVYIRRQRQSREAQRRHWDAEIQPHAVGRQVRDRSWGALPRLQQTEEQAGAAPAQAPERTATPGTPASS